MRLLLLVLALSFLPAMAARAQPPDNKLLDISPGIAQLHLVNNPADPRPDFVMKAWRENMNAHGYYMITFLKGSLTAPKKQNSEASDNPPLEIIGVENKKDGPAAHAIVTTNTADCVLDDYRLLFKKGTVFLIEAKTEWNNWRCVKNNVHFIIYKMFNNTGPDPEFNPTYFFRQQNEIAATKKYDDVDEAFKNENDRLINVAH